MKDCVIITSHCDNEETIGLLRECIKEIKSQGYPIIISTHIQVPNDIYSCVDYVIYDKENPLIYSNEVGGTNTYHWVSYPGFYQEYTLDFNHAYAVLKLIKNGVAVSKINGYDISHVVCYDYIIKDKNLLKIHTEALQEYDVYSYDFKVSSVGVSAGLFSFKNGKFIESFKNINSKEDYANQKLSIFEGFLEKMFLLNSSKIFKRDVDEIRNSNIIDKITNLGEIRKNIILNEEGNQIAFLFLTRVEESHYIFFISLSASEGELTLVVNFMDSVYKIKPKINFPNLIPIKKNQLESGIVIEIPEICFTDYYSPDTRFSAGKISDPNIILKIENILVK